MRTTLQSQAIHPMDAAVGRVFDVMIQHRKAIFFVLAALFLFTAAFAFAGTTGAEYKDAYNYFVGLITGYPGKIAAIMIGLSGVLMSWSKGSPLFFAGGILIGIVIWNLPKIVDGIFTATI